MPLIGICVDHVVHATEGGKDRSYFKLYPAYVEAVIRGGGTPVVLPMVDDVRLLAPAIRTLDGVVMIGADDYPPQWYGAPPHPNEEYCTEVRARFDRAFAEMIYATDLPLLLVCGGMQLACLLSGGAMHQHLPDLGGPLEHRDFRASPVTTTHEISITPGSRLHEALGVTRTRVNSMHHQAASRVGPRLNITARADDGVIECVEFNDHRWRVGTQWHPERMLDDPVMPRLWQAFVGACQSG
ncbi:gamma-glutamyl-gamma-aminobutyrate hydrolase family protein [bacterium]|nr:MAG: gamma-glutamyl-gamma-aminobutyrate hydrolase family protein [bacterium]RIK63111.1 MAG: hypothetical protein DCC64_08455 [Planctomycetota bacterium]